MKTCECVGDEKMKKWVGVGKMINATVNQRKRTKIDGDGRLSY